ncbi:hypothetical protein FRX31_032202 [Thalictrum thalictroides]|uniref:RNase H type-1 domain-containing protein n=1 Tax=Thalictrum thalictroides TaxID=46969 RepID=A0A7J6V1H6_THATH|nr:hypothetical protein FRX31_032202 [Thalictrum thalictroides]
MSVTDWIETWYKPPNNWLVNTEYWSSFCLASTWFIWKARCDLIFQNRFPSSVKTAQAIDTHLDKLQVQLMPNSDAQTHHHSMSEYNTTDIQHSSWLPPQNDRIKINVDISFVNHDSPVTVGFLMRLSNGQFLSAGSDICYASSSEEGECRGVLIAVKECLKHQLRKVEIESDLKSIADYFAGISVNLSWTSISILEEAKSICNLFESILFMYCNRTRNHCTHILARQRDRSLMDPLFFSFPPVWLLNQLTLNNISCNMAVA